MKGDFLKCGVLGWGMEIFWTGLHALGSENWKLTGYSSLWMFPIYGMAACIGPVGLARKYLHDGDFYGGVSFRHVFKAL